VISAAHRRAWQSDRALL